MPKTGKNIYKRKDGRWEGRYVKERNSNGKITYGSVYGKTCSEVKQRLMIFAVENPAHKKLIAASDKTNLTLVDVANQWLSAISLKVKPSTYAGYLATLNLHILPSLGKRIIQDLSAVDISRFAKEKLNNGRTDGNGGLSPKTVRDILSIIKAIIDFACKERIINNGFIITYPKHQQQTMRVLSRQEQLSLETVLTHDLNVHKLGILLCLYTGLRVGELCALRWQDLSKDFDMLSVRQTLQRVKNLNNDENKTKILIDTPKSQRSMREIPIPKFLSPHLRTGFSGDTKKS